MKGMLGMLLIQGWGRGKTGTTTSLVDHDTTEQAAAVTECRWLRLGAGVLRRRDMRGDGLHTTRFELVSQHANLGLVTVPREQGLVRATVKSAGEKEGVE